MAARGTVEPFRTSVDGLIITQALSASALCGLVFVERDSQTVSATPEAATMLGWGDCGSPVSFARLPTQLRSAVTEGWKREFPAGATVQELSLTTDGKSLQVRAFKASATTVVLVMRDLTGQCEFLEHLRQVDRLVNAGTLAASMAHEIKNALVVGKAQAELLLEKHPGLELADLLRRELNRIDAIVCRMLRFARPNRPSLAPVGLHEVLEQARRLTQARYGIGVRLIIEMGTSGDVVEGDADELQQVFVNLLLNAFEAAGNSGRVEVRTATVSSANGSLIEVRVSDSGPGVAAENLPRLFHPFFTTKETGTGLGLSISQQIVERHRGSIALESPPGAGATFIVRLPVMNR
jgi:signal transduction histidine kinase